MSILTPLLPPKVLFKSVSGFANRNAGSVYRVFIVCHFTYPGFFRIVQDIAIDMLLFTFQTD